jgi:hypothetical protein
MFDLRQQCLEFAASHPTPNVRLAVQYAQAGHDHLGAVLRPVSPGYGRRAGGGPMTAVLCSHGRVGWCFDDATPDARRDADFLYRHAYAYALPYDGAGLAEEYAVWLLNRSYVNGEVLLEGSHRTDFARFLDERNANRNR